MNTSKKKWMGFTGVGAALAAMIGKIWRRDGDQPGSPPRDGEPVDFPT